MIRSICIFALLLLGCIAQAADPAFVVFYNSGKVVKQVNGKAIALKKGDKLFTTDKVVMPDKAQLVLVCANFTVLQLKTKGTFPVTSLQAKCKSPQTTPSSAYFKYVWNKFAHEHKAPEADPRSYMKTYGAASRGKGVKTEMAIDTIFHYDGTLNIGWKPEKTLAVQVYATAADKQLLLTTKPSKRVNIDSIVKVLGKPGTYYWDFAGEQSAKFKILKVLTKKEYTQVMKFVATVVGPAPSEKAYLTAYMLEERHLLAEAAKYYEQAYRLDPEDREYKAAYLRFNP